ncbi:hypothetical protein IID27_02180 [Patescibacteria group bacterium]|nr:hypothetical protein [Patescibacteria group bacterium]
MQSTRSLLRAVLCAALLVFLTGCAVIEEYYLEQGTGIFAEQNKVLEAFTSVVEVFEEREDYKTADELYEAKDRLDDACKPLRSVSLLRFLGKVVSDVLSMEAFRSFDSCEEATLKAKGELNRIAPKLASLYLEP